MRYIALIYSDTVLNNSERNFAPHYALMEEAAAAGVLIAGEPLAPQATTLRLEKGKTFRSDGPFVETKEQLAGFYIFECPTLEEATKWGARVAEACQGALAVEVRVMPGVPLPGAKETATSRAGIPQKPV